MPDRVDRVTQIAEIIASTTPGMWLVGQAEPDLPPRGVLTHADDWIVVVEEAEGQRVIANFGQREHSEADAKAFLNERQMIMYLNDALMQEVGARGIISGIFRRAIDWQFNALNPKEPRQGIERLKSLLAHTTRERPIDLRPTQTDIRGILAYLGEDQDQQIPENPLYPMPVEESPEKP